MATLGQGKVDRWAWALGFLKPWANGSAHFSSKGLTKGLRPNFLNWAANEWYPLIFGLYFNPGPKPMKIKLKLRHSLGPHWETKKQQSSSVTTGNVTSDGASTADDAHPVSSSSYSFNISVVCFSSSIWSIFSLLHFPLFLDVAYIIYLVLCMFLVLQLNDYS